MEPLNKKLQTGHEKIDQQHCRFLQHLKTLKEVIEAGAGRERIAEMITLLQQYALIHFADEEEYMTLVGCPALIENRAAHREFSHKMDGWLELLSSSGSSVTLLLDIQRESSAWMLAHIASVDCKLKSCRKPFQGV